LKILVSAADKASSAGFWAHFNIVTYLLTYLLTYLSLPTVACRIAPIAHGVLQGETKSE